MNALSFVIDYVVGKSHLFLFMCLAFILPFFMSVCQSACLRYLVSISTAVYDEGYLFLVLDFPPGQLSVGELDHHVEERPQVVVAT